MTSTSSSALTALRTAMLAPPFFRGLVLFKPSAGSRRQSSETMTRGRSRRSATPPYHQEDGRIPTLGGHRPGRAGAPLPRPLRSGPDARLLAHGLRQSA